MINKYNYRNCDVVKNLQLMLFIFLFFIYVITSLYISVSIIHTYCNVCMYWLYIYIYNELNTVVLTKNLITWTDDIPERDLSTTIIALFFAAGSIYLYTCIYIHIQT